jgi:hypothetical protein
MSDPTPKAMLEQYRAHASEDVAAQARMFAEMRPAERQELLFYMLCNVNRGLQYVHSLIDKQAARTTSFEELLNTTKKH